MPAQSCSNTVTASRECQALSTLSSFPPKLKRIILSPTLDNAFPPIVSSPADSGGSETLINCPLGIPIPLWSALQQHYNTSQLRAIATICLHNTAELVPSSLPTIQSHFPFLLLQGPPGTGYLIWTPSPILTIYLSLGKTHTILGLISALLVVGVPNENQKRVGQRVWIPFPSS